MSERIHEIRVQTRISLTLSHLGELVLQPIKVNEGAKECGGLNVGAVHEHDDKVLEGGYRRIAGRRSSCCRRWRYRVRREGALGRGDRRGWQTGSCSLGRGGLVVDDDDVLDLSDDMPDHPTIDLLLHEPDKVGIMLVLGEERPRVATCV